MLRPPGAIDEPAFLEGCTRCNDCAKVCPVDAIFPAPAIMGAIRDTPMIDPMSAACVMCEDMPCIAACEPKVLRAEAGLKMGVAKIKPMNCLAFGGTICTVCSERCPVEGAITIVQGRPIIEEDICTGCGTCQYVCPAPYNAIAIMPDEARYLDAPGNIPEETASWRKQLFANKSLRPEDNISDADFSE